MHELDLIITLSAGLAAAFLLGFLTHQLKFSPILGYLLAGILIGPHTPGFVADMEIASQFAEIGVVLLMFGVGLQFHVKDLLAVRSIAVPGAVGQSLVATLLGVGAAVLFGWTPVSGLVLGMAVAVASTVVLMRVLIDNHRLDTVHGRIAVGWLVVEDIFTVLILVLLPTLAAFSVGGEADGGPENVLWIIGTTVAKLGVLCLLVLFFGSRLLPRLLVRVAQARSGELFTLCVLVLALTIATGSSLFFGISMAIGAFLAGMVVGQSEVSHQAAADALPMRDSFAVLFFVSVGMLFDPWILVEEPGLLLGVLAIILVGKPLAALLIVVVLGYSVRSALTVAIGLAQIGEFSFILAQAGGTLGLLPEEGQNILIATAILSITLNPLLFRTLDPVEAGLRKRKRVWAFLNRFAESRGRSVNLHTHSRLSDQAEGHHAVVVGFGPVGQTVLRIQKEFGIQPVVVDLNVDTVRELVSQGHLAIYGDASREEILKAAGILRAAYLVVTLPELVSRIPVIVAARILNPEIKILVRARYLAEKAMLEEMGATAVCYEEAEAAVGLAQYLLNKVGAPQKRIEEEADKIREEFAVRSWRPLLSEGEPLSDKQGTT